MAEFPVCMPADIYLQLLLDSTPPNQAVLCKADSTEKLREQKSFNMNLKNTLTPGITAQNQARSFLLCPHTNTNALNGECNFKVATAVVRRDNI